ncbi:MAG: ABC transporter substrate-binding protein [Chloroflexi bacterium]|nr:ABC transporter substrate-binding protein [Chloroflexota bacterium]
MRIHRTLVLGASLLMAFSSVAVGEASSPDIQTAQASIAPASGTPVEPGALPSGPIGDGQIKMGSAGFYESAIVAEIYAQSLEAAGLTVERKLSIGPRDVTWAAMQAGTDINIMPEYLFSFLAQALQAPDLATPDAAETAANLAGALAPLDFSVLGFTPAVDTNAFVVTAATAAQYSLASISDLAAIAGDIKWGLPPECATNPSCGGALLKYGIDISKLQVTELGACGGEMAAALVNGGVQVGELCSTQPDIAQNNLVALTDDLQTQGADNLAPIVRNDLLRALDAQGVDIAAVLDPVSAVITTEDLTALNVRVGVNNEDLDVVAREYLTSKGLLTAP